MDAKVEIEIEFYPSIVYCVLRVRLVLYDVLSTKTYPFPNHLQTKPLTTPIAQSKI